MTAHVLAWLQAQTRPFPRAGQWLSQCPGPEPLVLFPEFLSFLKFHNDPLSGYSEPGRGQSKLISLRCVCTHQSSEGSCFPSSEHSCDSRHWVSRHGGWGLGSYIQGTFSEAQENSTWCASGKS